MDKHKMRSTVALVALVLLVPLLGRVGGAAAANTATPTADATIVGTTITECGGGPHMRHEVKRPCGTEPSIIVLLNSAGQTVGRRRTFRHHSSKFQFDVRPGKYTLIVHLQEKPTTGWVREKIVTAVAHKVTHAGNFSPPVM
jgi:hypothetical protein